MVAKIETIGSATKWQKAVKFFVFTLFIVYPYSPKDLKKIITFEFDIIHTYISFLIMQVCLSQPGLVGVDLPFKKTSLN